MKDRPRLREHPDGAGKKGLGPAPVNSEHALKPYWSLAVVALWIVGRGHRAEILPGYNLLHLRQELLAAGGVPVGLV